MKTLLEDIEKIIQDNEWATLYKITEPTMEFKP